jgi:hypothetical protein
MLCCCQRQLDDNRDISSASKPAPALDKDKAFTEAVTAHPSPANTPVTQLPSLAQPTGHGDQPQPQVEQPKPAPAQVAVVKPFEKSKVEEKAPVKTQAPASQSPQKAPAAQQSPAKTPATTQPPKPGQPAPIEEKVSASALEPTHASPLVGGGEGGKHVSVIQVTGADSKRVPKNPSADSSLLAQIEALGRAVEEAAAKGQLRNRASCGPLASQVCALTSQVKQAAGDMSDSALQNAVSRLEAVASRLESLAVKGSGAAAGGDTGKFNFMLTNFLHGHLLSCGTSLGTVKTCEIRTPLGRVK